MIMISPNVIEKCNFIRIVVLTKGKEQLRKVQFLSSFILVGTTTYLVNAFVNSFLEHTQDSHKAYC